MKKSDNKRTLKRASNKATSAVKANERAIAKALTSSFREHVADFLAKSESSYGALVVLAKDGQRIIGTKDRFDERWPVFAGALRKCIVTANKDVNPKLYDAQQSKYNSVLTSVRRKCKELLGVPKARKNAPTSTRQTAETIKKAIADLKFDVMLPEQLLTFTRSRVAQLDGVVKKAYNAGKLTPNMRKDIAAIVAVAANLKAMADGAAPKATPKAKKVA